MGDGEIVVEMKLGAGGYISELRRTLTEEEKNARETKRLSKEVADAKAADLKRVADATGPVAKAHHETGLRIKDTHKDWKTLHDAQVSGAGKITSALDGVVGKIGAMAAGYFGVSQMLVLVNDELRTKINLQGKAAGEQLTVATARADIIRNFPTGTDAEVADALAAGREIAASTKTREEFIDKAIAEGLSASAGNLPATKAAVRAAAEFLPGREADIPLYAGAMLDLGKVSDSDDAAVNRGLMAYTGGRSRVVDPLQQARNIPKALIGIKQFGASTAEATSLYAGLTTSMADPLGEMSGSASVRLAEQLRTALPTVANFGQRLEYMWQHPDEAKKFMQGASFEAKAAGPIEDLVLNPKGKFANLYREGVSQLPNDAALAEMGNKIVKRIKDEPLGAVQRTDKTFVSGEQQMLLGNIDPATGSLNREGLKRTLLASGQGAFATKMDSWAYEWNSKVGTTGGRQEGIDTLERRRNDLLNPTEPAQGWGGAASSTLREPRASTEQERKDAAVLESMLTELKSIKTALDKRPAPSTRPALITPNDKGGKG